MIGWLFLGLAATGPVLTETPRSEIVRLGWDVPSKSCSVQVHGAEIGDPRTEVGRSALLRALPDSRNLIHLEGTMSTPFLCMQGVVDALQKSGRRFRVGFVSEPPGPAS